MTLFEITLVLAALLSSLVGGFLFAYAVVIMPGTAQLDDREFLRNFQITDSIIADNHPLFLLVWVGSAIALIACAALGLPHLQGADFALLLLATLAYLGGVQAATIIIHLPLNREVQQLSLDSMDEAALTAARERFEPRWNRSNRRRTVIACGVGLLLIVLALRVA